MTVRILFLLTRQFKLLYEVKELDRQGYAKRDISEKAGVPPFAVGKYLEQAKHFRAEMLRAILEESADIEESVKTGRLNDMLAVELFITKHSAK